jgi:hypothetical protein
MQRRSIRPVEGAQRVPFLCVSMHVQIPGLVYLQMGRQTCGAMQQNGTETVPSPVTTSKGVAPKHGIR